MTGNCFLPLANKRNKCFGIVVFGTVHQHGKLFAGKVKQQRQNKLSRLHHQRYWEGLKKGGGVPVAASCRKKLPNDECQKFKYAELSKNRQVRVALLLTLLVYIQLGHHCRH